MSKKTLEGKVIKDKNNNKEKGNVTTSKNKV